MLWRWAGPVQKSSGGSWQRQSALCAAAPLPRWPEADQDCQGTLFPLGQKCSVDSSLITAHLVIWSFFMKQRADMCTCKYTLSAVAHTLKCNQTLHRASKTMRSSSLDRARKIERPAVALQARKELKCQTVTATVKPGPESLASRVNRLKGLVNSEQKAQYWVDRTRSHPEFHWPCPPSSPVAVKLSGLLWACSNTCLCEPPAQLWAIIIIWSTREPS